VFVGTQPEIELTPEDQHMILDTVQLLLKAGTDTRSGNGLLTDLACAMGTHCGMKLGDLLQPFGGNIVPLLVSIIKLILVHESKFVCDRRQVLQTILRIPGSVFELVTDSSEMYETMKCGIREVFLCILNSNTTAMFMSDFRCECFTNKVVQKQCCDCQCVDLYSVLQDYILQKRNECIAFD